MTQSSGFLSSYRKLTSKLLSRHDESQAMSLAVGGDFDAVGRIEFAILLHHGLRRDDTVVDIGCGSGRLAIQLKDYLAGKYIGLDVVPELHQYAKRIAERKDWEFATAPGLTIPKPDESADFVCFFSVFTHLTHDESFRYLEEARRILRPGGKAIFSFLEFRVASHWVFFQQMIDDRRHDRVLSQFMSRDGIEAWANHLGMTVVEIADGDKPHVPLPAPVRWENGAVMEGVGNLGQSVCVLAKP